jgi:hypothetical protein
MNIYFGNIVRDNPTDFQEAQKWEEGIQDCAIPSSSGSHRLERGECGYAFLADLNDIV